MHASANRMLSVVYRVLVAEICFTSPCLRAPYKTSHITSGVKKAVALP